MLHSHFSRVGYSGVTSAYADALVDQFKQKRHDFIHVLRFHFLSTAAHDLFCNVTKLDPHVSQLIRSNLHTVGAHRLRNVRCPTSLLVFLAEENRRTW